MLPTGYERDPISGALVATDRIVTKSYDRAYVSYYETCPERDLSVIRHLAFRRLAPIARNVCDVGCGTGAFLAYCHECNPLLDTFGFDVSGYPLPDCVQVYTGWQSFPWDVLTFFDSLEHFPSLDFLATLKAKAVIVSLPWCHFSHLGAEWFANWKHRKPGEHIWHFDEVSLPALFHHHGYKLVSLGNPEDAIRRGDGRSPNILTATFTR